MKQYTRKELYKFTSQLYKIMKIKPSIFELKIMKGVVGYTLYKVNGKGPIAKDGFSAYKIQLDYKADIISTLIHESLHWMNPDWCETKVLKHERMILNSLSARQVKSIIKHFGECL